MQSLTMKCQNWNGSKNRPGGYGRYGKAKRYVHHLMFEIYCGPIPKGMKVCHRCNNPACIEPTHLYLDSQPGNIRYATELGRMNRGEKHGCAKLTEKQVREIRASGERQKVLAARYRVSQRTISDVKCVKKWKFVGELPTYNTKPQ